MGRLARIKSYYAASAHAAPNRTELDSSIDCDVCVVGGGIAGCSTALGAYVHFESGETMLLAALHDGTTFARVEARSPATSPADVVGLALAEFRDLGVRFGQ